MIELIKFAIGVIPFIVFCFLLKKGNITGSARGRQFLMPILALVYCIASLALLDDLHESIQRLLLFLTDELGVRFPALYGVDWTPWYTVIANTVLAAAFLVLKGLVLPILNWLWSKFQFLMDVTSGFFYGYEEELGQWLLKKKWSHLKHFYSSLFFTVSAIAAALLYLACIMPEEPWTAKPYYPVLAVIVIGEISFYLSGLTKSEFLEDILGEDEESYKIVNYGPLRTILHKLFKDYILFEDTSEHNRDLPSGFEILEGLKEDRNPSIVTLGEYFSHLKVGGESIDASYVKSAVELVRGNSVLIHNPFYRDLTRYLIFPVVKQLMEHKKCLVIAGRQAAVKDVKEWISGGLADMMSTSAFWKVEILAEGAVDSDVGIIGPEGLFDARAIESNSAFFQETSLVLLIEPSAVMSIGQIGLGLIAEKCREENSNVNFCILDRSIDGLVDALSHTLRINLTEVFAPSVSGGSCSQMFWNRETDYMQHKILPGISRYLGVGTEISAVALKYQIRDTYWISSSKFPAVDMKWIAGQYYEPISRYTELPVSQESFRRAFHVSPNLWELPVSDNLFLVVEDEFHNVFETGRIYSSRAVNQCFVNVISEDYLLRDYMLHNRNIFLKDPKAIPSIVPDFARTERNAIIRILMRMTAAPLSEAQVKKELALSGIEEQDTYGLLKKLIQKHCGISEANVGISFQEEPGKAPLETALHKYFSVGEGDIRQYAASLTRANYITEDEGERENNLGARLLSHVYQIHLPGQFLTIDGKYYEIQAINRQGVILRRAADHISGRKSYRQLREVTLNNFHAEENMSANRSHIGMEVIRGFCDITVGTGGYLELPSYGNAKLARRNEIDHIPDRNYRNKAVLRIRLKDSTEEIRSTLCLLLNELFKTVYPEGYHYVYAVTAGGFPESSSLADLLYRANFSFADEGGENEDSIFIIEDSEIDLGLTVSAERNLKRFLEIICDVLMWQEEALTDRFIVYGEKAYLKFGFDETDPALQLTGTAEYLGQLGFTVNPLYLARKAENLPIEWDFDPVKPGVHLCDFCAIELAGVEYERLHDGRERCSHCSRSTLKTVEELKEIYRVAVRNMETFFGIRIHGAVKIRMTNARKIAKHTGVKFVPTPGADGRVLGFSKKDKDGYTIYIENGSPKLAAIATMVHELTHIWQFINWNKRKMTRLYGKKEVKEVYEGMAKWAEIQYLLFLNEDAFARREEILTRRREDDYGRGFIRFEEAYPLERGTYVKRVTPFDQNPPL